MDYLSWTHLSGTENLKKSVERNIIPTRVELFKPKEIKEDKRIRYIMMFNISNLPMKGVVLKHFNLLAIMRRNLIIIKKV